MTDLPVFKRVCLLLRENGHLEYEAELQKYLKELNSNERELVMHASKRIQEMCHVRVLGDLNVKNMQGYDWLNMLSKLSRYAKKKAKEYGGKIR